MELHASWCAGAIGQCGNDGIQGIKKFVCKRELGLGEVMVVKVHGITDNNCMGVFGYDVVATVVVQGLVNVKPFVCREIQDRWREGLWCMPMGPMGVALKFNLPMRASAEVAVPVELGQSKLRVNCMENWLVPLQGWQRNGP